MYLFQHHLYKSSNNTNSCDIPKKAQEKENVLNDKYLPGVYFLRDQESSVVFIRLFNHTSATSLVRFNFG